MKKLISVILAVVLATSMLGVTAFADTLAGDADNNGKITATDARLILQHVAGLKTADVVERYDINGDKNITATDARMVLQIVAGIIEHPDAGNEEDNEDAEHLEYFVNTFNNVKTNAKSVTRVGTKAYNYNNIVELNPIIEMADPTMKDQLTEEFSDELNEVNETFEGDDIYEQFPPYNNVCNLTMDDVSKISFVEEGNYYLVEIDVKGKKNPSQYEGVGNVATIVTKELMEAEMSPEDRELMSIDCDYQEAHVKAKIEKETGNMIEYSVDYPMIMIMSINGMGEMARIGMGMYEEWTIAY